MPPLLSEHLADAATTLLEFASHLSSEPDGGVTSATGGRGAAAVAARTGWRPFPASSGSGFVELDIPGSLMWRAWMVLPEQGVVRVVNEEQLTDADFDIWWGVHDGSHLDHVATFPLDRPAPIEFGSGLLVTEALIMSLELLAAAEAKVEGSSGPQTSVRAGLLERVGRLPGVFSHPTLTTLAERSGVVPEAEFPEMPTLAAAYVAGPLHMISTGFVHPLIPDQTARILRSRWDRAAETDAAVAGLLNASRKGLTWPTN